MTASGLRSALGLVRTFVGEQTVWALVGEASLRCTTAARITTQDLEALPIDRTAADRHVADIMSALEAYSSRRAETPGGASWLYVQHVPVRRLVTQLVRKLLALSAWPEFAETPGLVTVAPYEGLLGLRDSSSREYRAYTVTWSGVAYALGAPAPHNPARSARLRKLTTLHPDRRLARAPTASAAPTAEIVALSWSTRHAQTLLPVLEELADEGRSSVLVDLATDPMERCSAPAGESITLCRAPAKALTASGTVPGLRLDTEDPDGTEGTVQVGVHTVRLDRLERLAAALLEGGAGCTQPSWRSIVRVEEWLHELLDAVRPHTVLLSNDISPLGALGAHAAERHGATTVNVQHGAWIPGAVAWPALHSRHIVVMGDRDVAPARAWVRHPDAAIHVLGQPRFDALAGLGQEAQRRYLQKLFGADRGPERIAVWACQPFGPERLQAQADIILDGLKEAQGLWGLVIAPHPAQGGHLFERLLRRDGEPPVAVADLSVGARGCLAGADALVSVSSTCGIEAVLLDVPLLELDRAGDRTLGLAEHAIAHRCRTAADVADALDLVSRGSARVPREARDAVCRWRGHSADDIAQLIVRQAEAGISRTDPIDHHPECAESGMPEGEGATIR
ncbi:hypothetical protein [Streptomyces decoyicus]|uniref:hypothetical protein n=1 Tax=Streptomyces decoyicus TaxID=249567 RepID=UPI00069F54F9|nr:hypothetical protein [Streptomyces decoyicus]KOG50600.1 hypothetical protein ADK74_00735 [Streptomyces decoyicus]QZY15195.1 hypothetical protein K7C20_07965 [Streptomyces decoyicus]